MALIKCRECGKEYSNQAAACPACACPTMPGPARPTPVVAKAPVQTELTAKTWKGLQVLCLFAAVSGCVISMATIGDQTSGHPLSTGLIFGSVLLAVGLLGFIYARVMAWWEHG